MSGCIMDFPTAWKFVAKTKLSQHHKKCSYRTEKRALLCDCAVLNNEYERRKQIVSQNALLPDAEEKE